MTAIDQSPALSGANAVAARTAARGDVIDHEPVEARSELDRILALTENTSIPIERISQVIELFQKVERERSRRAFEVALAKAKGEYGKITKKNHVKFVTTKGVTEYWHEDLADIEAAIGPAFAANGLSYRWRTRSELNLPIQVTCVVTHIGGHFEETTLESGRDDSGSKNPHQSIASALTYLQRYTLRSAAGLAVGKDDDARMAGARQGDAAPVEYISEDQQVELMTLLAETNTRLESFCTSGGIDGLADITVQNFSRAKKQLLDLKVKIAQRQASAKGGAR